MCVSWLCVALSERTREGEAACQQIVEMPSVQSPAADCAIYMYFALPFFPQRKRKREMLFQLKKHLFRTNTHKRSGHCSKTTPSFGD